MYDKLYIIKNPAVESIFKNYPAHAKERMDQLRQLVFKTANELEEITELEETLKWGEPSYIARKGSTLRMDWKQRSPDQCALYFSCTTLLVPTFRLLYNDQLSFEKNRAIILPLNKPLPVKILSECMSMALRYHRIKHLPGLGY